MPNVAKLRARKDVKGLINALRHRKPEVRKAAATALGEIREIRAEEPLLTMMAEEENASVFEVAHKAWININSGAAARLRDQLIHDIPTIPDDVKEDSATRRSPRESTTDTKRARTADGSSTYCQICGSTRGPFAAEPFPAGTAKAPMFNRCQVCATDPNRGLYHLNLSVILKDRFSYTFVECEGCGGPFYANTPGVAYAWERFQIGSCPVCGTTLPKRQSR